MGNLWEISGITHNGWIIEYVYEIREDGDFGDEDEFETCMMCKYERIRCFQVVFLEYIKSLARIPFQ